VWDVDVERVAARVCAVGGPLDQDTWSRRVSPDVTYDRVAAASNAGDEFVFDCDVCRTGEELANLAGHRITRALTVQERQRFDVP
jgi:hypothetical protein